jgi:membrane associated rhomboid family serine protease
MRISRILILINIVVFIAWQLAKKNSSVNFMAENFLVSWTSLLEGRYWTLLTSVFSHISLMHIFFNMFVLSSFGPVVEDVLGQARFLKFYLVAGIFSSFCHAFVSKTLLHAPDLPALGASGAISGMIFLFAFLFPKQKIYLFAVLPIPAIWAALVFVGIDVWGLVAQAEGGGFQIGHGAHLGGALAGVIYYYFFLKPKLSVQP